MEEREFKGKTKSGEWVYGMLGYTINNSKLGKERKVYFIQDNEGSSVVDVESVEDLR